MTDVRRNVRTYHGFDRTPVQVLIEGRGWVQGVVRMQWQDEHDAWWVEVTHDSGENWSSTIDTFPADRVRPDETDYSARGTVGESQ